MQNADVIITLLYNLIARMTETKMSVLKRTGCLKKGIGV